MVNKNIGRLATQGYYAFQQTRIGLQNQIRDVVRKLNEGIAFDEVEEKKEDRKFSAEYGDAKLLPLVKKMFDENKIDEETYIFLADCIEIVIGKVLDENTGKLITPKIICGACGLTTDDNFTGIAGIETQYKKLMEKTIKKEPIFTRFLSKIRGMGPIHSANLLKAFGDCSGYPTISKLWSHAGYGVRDDGIAPRRQKGVEINYSPKLRTMIWKISDNLMKQNKGLYRKTYDEHKRKQASRVFEEGVLAKKYNGYKEEDITLSKGHSHNRALRKAVKLFLSHFWEASRELAGLPTERTYVEGVLEHEHIIHWREALDLEGCLLRE